MSPSVIEVTEMTVLRVDILCPASIHSVDEQMLELARRLGVRVSADWYGIELIADPRGKWGDVMRQWERAIKASEELSEIAFNTYCAARDWKNMLGETISPWDQQDETMRNAWRATAAAVAKKIALDKGEA